MRIVLDANVVIAWLLPQRDEEKHVEQALAIFSHIRSAELTPIAPVHWLAEVAAVLIRLSPKTAEESVSLLYAMDIPVVSTLDVYHLAGDLACDLNHHLFDTLYHAVAIADRDAHFVTADQRYYKKARKYGHIIPLADFQI